MKKIDVLFQGWGHEWVLGTLASSGPHLVFEYSPEALQRGIEFSQVHLPLRAAAYSDFPAHLFGLPGLVSDALPDGWGLLLMDKMFLKIGRSRSSITALDRLGFIGARAMGALSFRPSLDMPLSADEATLLEIANAAADVIDDKDTPALKLLALVGGSPHGVRPKALVQFDAVAGRVSTLESSTGAPWLVKFPAQGEHKEVCAIEHAYAIMARACGAEVPRTQYFDLAKDMAAFGVERFDRAGGMRVPVHSLAGALHADFRVPSLDYQTILRATRAFTKDETEVSKAFGRCVLNVVMNNRDDHAKNFAFRMDEKMQWKLAPLYDFTFNTGPRGWHQATVMGEGQAPGRSELQKLAANCGVAPATATRIIDRVCAEASRMASFLIDFDIRKASRKAIVDAVNANLRRCAASPAQYQRVR